MEHKILILNDEEVGKCLPDADEAVELIAMAFGAHAHGRTDQPLKPYVRPGGYEGERACGRLITMPAWLGPPFQVWGLKAVTSIWTNTSDRGLPRASAPILLFNPTNGLPDVLMNGSALSAWRTAAATTFAIERLHNSVTPRVALLGCGVVGEKIADFIVARMDVGEFWLFDLSRPAAQQLRTRLSNRSGWGAEVVDSPETALRDATAVVAATTAETPYLRAGWFSAGSVYVAISLVDAEIDYLGKADVLVVDDWAQCCRERKPLEKAAAQGLIHRDRAITFADLALGRPARKKASDRIYVNPMGVAIEDLAVAWSTWRRALARGLGQWVRWL